jgi:hypothetical protein
MPDIVFHVPVLYVKYVRPSNSDTAFQFLKMTTGVNSDLRYDAGEHEKTNAVDLI